jgi:glutamyl-tRNA synthetase
MRDATHKLSKRRGDPTYEDLLAQGYLPEAVLSYVALLGWSPGGAREMFTLKELVEHFTLSGLSRSPAIFDKGKLTWLNGQFLRALPPEAFYAWALPSIRRAVRREDIDTRATAALLAPRVETWADIPPQLDFLDELPAYEAALYEHKKSKCDRPGSLLVLKEALPALETLPAWTADVLRDALTALAVRLGVKNGQVFWPVRTAVSGKPSTPGGGAELCALLGREETLRRIRAGIEKLETARP